MAFWHNPLLRKTAVLMLAGLLSLALIVATSLRLSYRVQADAAAVIQEREVRTQAATLLALARDAEVGQRGYLLTEEAPYLVPYDNAIPRIPDAIAQLQASAERQPGLRDATQKTVTLLQEKMDELAETIALFRDGRRTEALAIVGSNKGKAAMDGLRTVLGSIIATSDQRVSALLGSQQQTTVALFWVNALSSGLILALALAAGWTVARYTGELVEARRAVAMSNLTLESRVKDRTIALARANDEIQRFAYIVSHDLRAPLVNIVGFTSELESSTQALQRFVAHASVPETDTTLADEAKTAVDEDLPEAIGFIRASTSKMDRLINAILKLSREGRRELRPEPVDLKAVFEAIAASLQHQLDTAGARIDITKTLPTLVSDRLAIEQVFGNLIDNAVKYLSADRPGLIEISGTTAGSFLTLDVTDNGRGIAVGDQERIFELFRRAGTQNTAGEGIGLAHVRALVRRLGGDIAVTSELGRGSRFRVTLPRVYVSRPEQDPA